MVNCNETLRFTSICLQNWRNFTEVRVDLQRRAFLVGPNASGKSNFLDAFRFLRDIVSIGGGFQEAVRRRGGLSKIRCLAARRNPNVSIEVTIGTEANKYMWKYKLSFGQDPQKRLLIKEEKVMKGEEITLERPNQEDKKDKERLTQTHLEQINVNQPFREIADFFKTIYYLHIVPQLIREPERSAGKIKDPYGGDFLEQIAKTNKKTRSSRLNTIVKALRIAVPRLQTLELWQDEKGIPHLRGKYEHWRYPGAWQTEEHFSDGTLRLIGLLWALLDGNGPLLLEEPELSLHPEIVRHIPQIFARLQNRTGRQVIVSTHSQELLRDEGIGLDEIFLFIPQQEETLVKPANSFNEIVELIRFGKSLPDTILPYTSPKEVSQLSLFPDA